MSRLYPYGVFEEWFYTSLYRHNGSEYLKRLIKYLKLQKSNYKSSYYDEVHRPEWLDEYSDNTLILSHWEIMCCRWGDWNSDESYILHGCLDDCIEELQLMQHQQNLYFMMFKDNTN